MDVQQSDRSAAWRRFRESPLGFFVYMSVSILTLGAILMFVIWPRSSPEDVALERIELADHVAAVGLKYKEILRAKN